jgi:uncharacterized protein (DUF433 family)
MSVAAPTAEKLMPAYPLAQVARFVGCNPATLRSWMRGRNYKVGGSSKRSAPMLRADSKRGEALTFLDLVEAHILQLLRKGYGIPMKNFRTAAEELRKIGKGIHFLAHKDFVYDNQHIYIRAEKYLISLSERGQHVDREIIKEGLKQLMYGEDGYADVFYPRIGGRLQETVMLTPSIGYGQPTIKRIGVNTHAIAARFLAGEHMPDLVADYGATQEEIEEALRCAGELSRAS